MSAAFFYCEWQIERDEIKNRRILIEISAEFGCELRIARAQRTRQRSQGYLCETFAIEASSTLQAVQFIQKASTLKGFTHWVKITESQYKKMVEFPLLGKRLPLHLHIPNFSAVEGLAEFAAKNKELAQLLSTRTPEYSICNWLILVLDPLIENTNLSVGRMIELTPFYALGSAAVKLGVGRELRMRAIKKDAKGNFRHEIVIRTFDSSELQTFIAQAEVLGFVNWHPTAAENYLDAIPIISFEAFADIYPAWRYLSKFNQSNAQEFM